VTAHRLDRTRARRIAVRAQLLDAHRPGDLLTVVERLTFLQVDPTAAVAPNADLVAWTRLGNRYAPADLTAALERDRTLYEVRAMVRPMSHLPLYLADMASWASAGPTPREWMAANDRFRRDVLARLREAGPLLSRDVPDTSQVRWPSTGWTNDRNVTQMLEFLISRGEVAIAGRVGRQRLWDLAERVYPPDTPVVPAAEARRRRDQLRLRSLGVARPLVVGEAGAPAEVEGTRGAWRVDPEALDRDFAGRTALLSPFDRLVHDRKRAVDLFDFDYKLEMYLPKARRRWGYFALPVLRGDRLVGKADVAVDRKAGRLLVAALHRDRPWPRAVERAVDRELDALAAWSGVRR
jgi:uncharacterized protein YcaQ